jgi:hypothetical protein
MKYIFLLFIIIYFSGCQKALDDLNKSLEESRNNSNIRQNKNVEQTNSSFGQDGLERIKKSQEKWAEERKQESLKYEKEKEQRKIKQANEKATIDAERNKDMIEKEMQTEKPKRGRKAKK